MKKMILVGLIISFFIFSVNVASPATLKLNQTNRGLIGETYISSSDPTSNFDTSSFQQVSELFGTEERTLFMFNITNLSGKTINSANLTMFTSSPTGTFGAHWANNTWRSSTVTWNTKPTNNNTPTSTLTPSGGYDTWSVTNIIKKCVADSWPNCSVMMKYNTTSASMTIVNYTGGGNTYVNVDYTDPVTSSCTYSGSGDWNVTCSDNCSITTNYNLPSNTLRLTGTGTFTVLSNVTINRLEKQQGCKLVTKQGDGNILAIKAG